MAIRYAKGLINLTLKQELEERKETIERLKELYENHKYNKDIVTLYKWVLVEFNKK